MAKKAVSRSSSTGGRPKKKAQVDNSSTRGRKGVEFNSMLTLNLGDIVRGFAVAVLTGVWLTIASLFTQDFDVFSADWVAIGKLAINGGFFALVGYINKNLLTASNGKFLGAI